MSLEAIMVIGMTMIILISFTNLNWASYYTSREIGEAGEARMIGELLATTINSVYANGEGYSVELDDDKINFAEIGNSTTLTGLGINLPIIIDTDGRTVNVTRSLRTGSNSNWTATIRIFSRNITQTDPTAEYPELTVYNNGTYVIIYAYNSSINVGT